MTADALLGLLRSRGLAPRVVGGRLRVGPAERLDDELRALVRARAGDLVDALTPPVAAPEPEPERAREPLGYRTVDPAALRAAVEELGAWNRAVMRR